MPEYTAGRIVADALDVAGLFLTPHGRSHRKRTGEDRHPHRRDHFSHHVLLL
jgi:hypothetical protein